MDDADIEQSSLDERSIRTRHRTVLILCTLTILAALLLIVVDHDRIAVKGFEQHPLPHLCMFRALFEWNCYGCGLTRSVVHFFHGRWSESFAVHPAGVVFSLMILMQIPYRLIGLRGVTALPAGALAPRVFRIVSVILLIVAFGIRVLT